jgi:hypothetical protein
MHFNFTSEAQRHYCSKGQPNFERPCVYVSVQALLAKYYYGDKIKDAEMWRPNSK